ncbi:MAG: hypothetical protein ACR2OJ_14070 [Hyphomicrobiales bacterium]
MNLYGPISADTLSEIASGEQTVLLLCESWEDIARCDSLIEHLRAEQPRLHVVPFALKTPEDGAAQRTKFDGPVLTRFCKLRRVRSVFVVSENLKLFKGLSGVLNEMAIPGFGLSHDHGTSLGEVVPDDHAVNVVPLNTVAGRICDELFEKTSPVSSYVIAPEDLVSFVIAANGLRNIRESMKERGFVMRIAGNVRNRLRTSHGRLLSVPGISRIQSSAALADKLNHPKTIICLGNGPSSEIEALLQISHDCLFRVNAIWLERGYMMEPDVVFCGPAAAMKDKRLRGAIVGAADEIAERRLLKERLFFPNRWPLSYFVSSEMEPYTSAFYDQLKARTENRFAADWYPTNGARMLAVAVALNPVSLVIAGIDLFTHPEGAYAGGSTVPNSYAAFHDRDLECAFIFSILRQYEGELIILSDALKERWEAYQEHEDWSD